MSIIYILLAAFGLGFLIFIHELAHFLMAQRVGMKIEIFSIGLGKAIYSWNRKGVKWQIGWLPLGGYVKIAGMQTEKGVDPYSVKGGYFSKKPLDRIKVAAIAPIVNIVFAFFLFTVLWVSGGREKPFNEFTNRAGWIDPTSELYSEGIRPGDQIISYNKHKVNSFKELLQAPMLSGGSLNLQGYKINYFDNTKKPFDITVSPYPHPEYLGEDLLTSGILAPASYLVYQSSNSLLPASPMTSSAIEKGDRLFWVDGELIFSTEQLNQVINSSQVLLTISRNNQHYLARVPRIAISDLKTPAFYHDELNDWKYESNLRNDLSSYLTIPYVINDEGIIESSLRITTIHKKHFLNTSARASSALRTLLPGDKIVAVDGNQVDNGYQILKALQKEQHFIIVQTGNEKFPLVSATEADLDFDKKVDWASLELIANSIGTDNPLKTSGRFKLLNPIIPKTMQQIAKDSHQISDYDKRVQERFKLINEISNPDKREQILKKFNKDQNKVYLGIALQDRLVIYNPPPYVLFSQVASDIWNTLSALVKGNLNPKWLSGPIGIVQVMHYGWSIGIKEALFWLGLISLNLGVLNLLPIPVLDGGHICFAFWEMVTKKRIQIKTMERLIIPFVVLLIGFFIFVTYHDLSRLFKGF